MKIKTLVCLDFEGNDGDIIDYNVFPLYFPITYANICALTNKGVRLVKGDVIIGGDSGHGEAFVVESVMFHCSEKEMEIGYSFKINLATLYELQEILNSHNLYIWSRRGRIKVSKNKPDLY